MAKLTDTDALVAARCAVPGWIRWAQSTRDGMAHAFPIQDCQCDRWLRAVCSHTIPPAALGPATVVGVRCGRCLLAVTAARTARHRASRPGGCATPAAHHHPTRPGHLDPAPTAGLPARVLAADEGADGGVVDGVDGGGVGRPRRRGAGRGLVVGVACWSSGWRWWGHSAVTSATAVRVELSSTMVLSVANAATSAWRARLLTARG